MKHYPEDTALGICERAHILIEGKTISAKAAHGLNLWPVIDSLVYHHGYRLVMVPGSMVLRMPEAETPCGKTPTRPDWLEREIRQYLPHPVANDGITEAVQRDREAHSKKFAPVRFTPALPAFLGGPR